MAITLNGTTGITTPDITSAGSLNIDASAPDNSLVVNSAGNVGISTSSPNYQLQINGTSFGLTQYTTTANGTGSADGLVVGINDANEAFVNNRENGIIRFHTNNTERARIDSSGSLLVGTASTSNTNGVMLSKGGAVGGGVVTLFKTASGGTNALVNFYGTNYVGGINFDNTSTSFPTSSDLRLKKDIVDSASASAKIDQIRIVSHGWKHDDSVVEFGVIAQELVNIVPQAVTVGDNNEKTKTIWGVDYSKLVPLLVKSHQEQQATITALTARIEALENNIV